MLESLPKRLPALALLVLFLGSCHLHRPTTPIGVPAYGHASYALGWKGKDSSWDGAEDEFVFGVIDFDARIQRTPVWFVGKILTGTADEPDYVTDPRADSSGTSEFAIGVRKYTVLASAEPFVSGGIALLYGSITGDDDYSYYSRTLDSEIAPGG